MSDQPRLWDHLVAQATAGELTVDLDGATFDAIDRAFDEFIQELVAVQAQVLNLADRGSYGMGIAADMLRTASDTIAHLDAKAVGGPNSADAVITQYLDVAERVRAMFQAMRKSYAGTEIHNASAITHTEPSR